MDVQPVKSGAVTWLKPTGRRLPAGSGENRPLFFRSLVMTCDTCVPSAAVVPAAVETGAGVGISGIAIGIGCEMPPVMSTRICAEAGAAAMPSASARVRGARLRIMVSIGIASAFMPRPSG